MDYAGLTGTDREAFSAGVFMGIRLTMIDKDEALAQVVAGHTKGGLHDLISTLLADRYRDVVERRLALTLFKAGFNGETTLQVRSQEQKDVAASVEAFFKGEHDAQAPS